MRFTDEQRQFATAIRDFCARECGTRQQREALTAGGREHSTGELIAKFADLGWLGVSVPEDHGGARAGTVEECIFLDEACRRLASIHAYSAPTTVSSRYMRWGTEEEKRATRGVVCRGRLKAIAPSEPEAGSDPGSVRCRTMREGDECAISGQKTWL